MPGPRSEVFALRTLLRELLAGPTDKLTAESKAARSAGCAVSKATDKTAGQRLSNIVELISRLDAIRRHRRSKGTASAL